MDLDTIRVFALSKLANANLAQAYGAYRAELLRLQHA